MSERSKNEPTLEELKMLALEAEAQPVVQVPEIIFPEADGDGNAKKPTKAQKEAAPSIIPMLKRYASVLVAEHQIIYVQESQMFYTFDRTHYVPRDPLFFGQIFERSEYSSLSNLKNNNELVGILKRSCGISQSDFESSTAGFINFQNGHYCKRTKQITDHAQCPTNRFFTYCLQFSYDPQALAPRWEAFMAQCFKSRETGTLDLGSVQCLHEFMGYSLSGDENWADRMLLAVGTSGANGKGTIWNIMRRLVGDDAYSALPVEVLANFKERETIDGKLVNLSSEESPQAFVGAEHALKQLTSRDAVQFRPMYKKAYSKPSRTKLWMSCNSIPVAHDTSGGWMRRFLILEFLNKAAEPEDFHTESETYTRGFVYLKDPKLEDKLSEELPGIFNLAIAAYEQAVARGALTVPARSKELVEEQLNDDSVTDIVRGAFLQASMDAYLSNEQIMKTYHDASGARGAGARVSMRVVLKTLRERFNTKPYKNGSIHGLRGLILKLNNTSNGSSTDPI